MNEFDIKLNFDLSDEPSLIAPGYYNSVIHYIGSSTGYDICIYFRITDKKFHGRIINKSFLVHPDKKDQEGKSIARTQLKNVAKCIGLIKPGKQLQSIKIEEWLNKPIKIEIRGENLSDYQVAGFKAINNPLTILLIKIKEFIRRIFHKD